MSDQLCLYCFKSFKSKDMLVRCQLYDDEQCSFVEDELHYKYWLEEKDLEQPHLSPLGEDGLLRRMSGRLKRQYACEGCNEPSDLLCCPHCHNALPHPEDREGEIILSVLGGPNCGKTTYLGLLCETFNSVMAPRYSLQPHNEEVRDRYEETYVGPLRNLEVLASTRESVVDSEVRHPLIFELREAGEAAQARRLIVMHDAAGEQLGDRMALRRFNRYVIHSQGMLLFVDSEQAPKIRPRITDPPVVARHADDIINTVTRQIINEKNLSGHRVAGHLAVVLSKLDILSDASIIGEPPVLQQDFDPEVLKPSRHGPLLCRSEAIAVSDEVESLLHVIGAQSIVGTVGGLFDSFGYFGVSALGHAPDPHTRRLLRTPEPLRLLDPFLWLLAKLEVIDTTD